MNTYCERVREGFSCGHRFIPDADRPLPVATLCQLALLWAIIGEKEASSCIASYVAPILEFKELWCPEKEYNAHETELSIALFLRAMGKGNMDVPSDPFFAWLYEKNPTIELSTAKIDYQLLNGDLVLTNSVQAGAFRAGTVRASAFGPHALPLSDSELFGVAAADNSWYCSKGQKESWCQIIPINSRTLDLQTISNRALPFVFYLHADFCKIGDKLFKPKSLQRFAGEIQSAQFNELTLTIDRPLQVELIPLAGEGSFWGASFLLALHLPPMSGKIRLSW